eukprot:gb/GEZN01005063.1/.p1 GENE.gb/GEZN01005063.1/~~gb/GEZN01005063.1/.p1  ORF type:complete len:531 (+),score=70.06 gb/GEZN01005063.1/:53-1594(+)
MMLAKGLANKNPMLEILVLEREPQENFTPSGYPKTSYCYNLSRGHPERMLERHIWEEEDYAGTSATNGGHDDMCLFTPAGPKIVASPFRSMKILKSTLWIQRLHLLTALHRSLSRSPQITLRFGARVTNLTVQHGKVHVFIENDRTPLIADLVVGCDGVNSTVCQMLQAWTNQQRFQVIKKAQISTGMRFKSCLLDLSPELLPDGCLAICRSAITKKLIFAVFEQKADGPRLMGVVRYQTDHDLLFKEGLTPKELRAYLYKHAPAIPWDEVMKPEEAEAFCRAGRGIEFPQAAHCTDAVWTNQDKTCAVVLCGDSMHSFPPDSGQGVNAGLQDAFRLMDLLSACPDLQQHKQQQQQQQQQQQEQEQPSSTSSGPDTHNRQSKENKPQPFSQVLLKNLSQYDSETQAEAHAIFQISQVAAPYQYSCVPRDRGYVYWVLRNLVFEYVGSKLLPGFIQPPIMFLSSQPEAYPYATMWEGYVRNTRILRTFSVLSAVAVSLVFLKVFQFLKKRRKNS